MRRFIARLLIGLALLVLAVVVTVSILLRTSWMHQKLLAAMSDELGLDVAAEAMKIRWAGETTLEHLSVQMPLSDEPFFTSDTIQILHAPLPLLPFARQLGLNQVRLERPRIQLRRDSYGRWNIQDVLIRLRTRRGPGAQQSAITLPDLEIRNAVVEASDPNGALAVVGPVTVRGESAGRSVWTFSVDGGRGVGLRGRVAQAGDWAHRLDFDVSDLNSAVTGVAVDALPSLRATGRWEGRVGQDRLTGRLELQHLDLESFVVRGVLHVSAEPDRLTLSPNALTIREPTGTNDTIRASAGSLAVSDTMVTIEQLAVVAGPLAAQVTGHWNLESRTGLLSASWAAGVAGQGIQFHGTSRLDVSAPRLGRKEALLSVEGEAQTTAGLGHIRAQLEGSGRQWQKTRWQIEVPDFVWSRDPEDVDMSGASAEILVDWPTAQLTALRVPSASQVDAEAHLDVHTAEWSLRLDSTNIDLAGVDTPPFDLYVAAEGNADRAVVSEARLVQGPKHLTAEGELAIPALRLENVRLSGQWPGTQRSSQTDEERGGLWRCEVDVNGGIRPLDLKAQGRVTGEGVLLGKKEVERVDVTVGAGIDPNRVDVATEPFGLLGGQWQVTGQHRLSDQLSQLALVVSDLSLTSAAEMAGSPLRCRGRAGARLQLAVPQFDMGRAVAFGSWSATDVQVPPLTAPRAQGKLRISSGRVRFNEIRMEHGDGVLQGSMQFRLDQPQLLSVELESRSWPLSASAVPARLSVDVQTKLQIDVRNRSLDGHGDIAGRVIWDHNDIGRLNLSTRLDGKALHVSEFRAEVLGGLIDGEATIPLNRWTDSVARFAWRGIEPWPLLPPSNRFIAPGSQLDGSLVAEHIGNELRALEPMKLRLNAALTAGSANPAGVRDCNLVGYLGPRRLLVDRLLVHLLDGKVQARGRISSHPDGLYLSAVADFNAVDLNRLVHTLDPNAAEMPGRLAGTVNAVFSRRRGLMGGQADVSITRSDLINSRVVRTLYDALSLNLGAREPTGTGQARILLDGKRATIPSLVYFNRGVEIRGAVQIDDISLGARSPIGGYAVGSTRVLKDIRLPGVRELDRLMSSLQTGVASVQFDGTVGETKVTVVPLPVVSGALRRLLWSQLRESEADSSP
jgi:hypothetical protein